jgi:hypothetical protein
MRNADALRSRAHSWVNAAYTTQYAGRDMGAVVSSFAHVYCRGARAWRIVSGSTMYTRCRLAI